MSRFFSRKYASLVAYVPGEQPKEKLFLKLNTNESPFPPSPKAVEYARQAAEDLHLYSDPDCTALVRAAANRLNVAPNEILFTNGSDEILNFAFMAFCDADHPAIFPDITYGFYKVFAQLNGVPYREIPLKDDLTVDLTPYEESNATVFLANPNAPTGIVLDAKKIESLVAGNPDRVVVIDEAYIDFGGESVVPLIRKYDNLLVTQTFSKSRSLAGGRLGFGIGCADLIRDLTTIKYSTNPFNVNRMTMAAGIGAIEDEAYFRSNCKTIVENRIRLTDALRAMGFFVCDSSTNFVFAKHPSLGGKELYTLLRQNGVLVRHFDTPRLKEFNRITVGDDEQTKLLISILRQITEATL